MQDIHGGNLWKMAADLKIEPDNILDLSTNTFTDCGNITHNLVAGLNLHFMHYPDPESIALRQSIARHEQVNIDQVLTGNGAAQLIWLCLEALAPVHVLLIGPLFSEYARACSALGIKYTICSFSEDMAFAPSYEDLEKLERIEADLAILCLPNNPACTCYFPQADLFAALRVKTILADLSYQEFLYGTPDYNLTRYKALAKLCSSLSSLISFISLHSVTKFFCCPGVRLGYVLGEEKIIAKLRTRQPPWMVSDQAQQLGVELFGHIHKYQDKLSSLRHNVEELAQALGSLDIFSKNRIFKGQSFVLAALHNTKQTAQLCSFLKKNKILIRNCDTITGMPRGYVRIQARDDLNILFNLLARFE